MLASAALTQLLQSDANSRYVRQFSVESTGDTLFVDIMQEIDGPVDVDDVHDFYQSLIDTCCHLLSPSDSTDTVDGDTGHVSIVFDTRYYIRVRRGVDGVIVVTRGDMGTMMEFVQTIDPFALHRWDDIVSCHNDSSNNRADSNDQRWDARADSVWL